MAAFGQLERSERITRARFERGLNQKLDVIRVTQLREEQAATIPTLDARRDAALFRLATLTGKPRRRCPIPCANGTPRPTSRSRSRLATDACCWPGGPTSRRQNAVWQPIPSGSALLPPISIPPFHWATRSAPRLLGPPIFSGAGRGPSRSCCLRRCRSHRAGGDRDRAFGLSRRAPSPGQAGCCARGCAARCESQRRTAGERAGSQQAKRITDWLTHFARTVLDAQEHSLALIDFLLAKVKFYDRFRDQMNERQARVIARMFREGIDGFTGGLSAANYITITGTSRATATRDLHELVAMGALTQTGMLKSTRYQLAIK